MTLSWGSPPAVLALGAAEVDVWQVALEPGAARVGELASTLDAVEAERAARFHFERDRRAFTVARGALRSLIGRYTGISPRAVTFAYGKNGKPWLAGGADLAFNVSHSGGVALIAFTRGREVGVDVEQRRVLADLMGLAKTVFSPRELEVLGGLGAHDQEAAFFACWARKEAFIKATGEGLSRALDSFDVTLAPGEPARILRALGESLPLRWTMHEIVVDDHHAAALVVDGEVAALRFFRG